MSRRLVIDLSAPLPLALFADPIDSAIVLSLFCDARALPDDRQADPRGWWGDVLADVPYDRWGSRLWLLAQRAKNTPQTLRDAAHYAREALQWMVDDGVARSLDVSARAAGDETLLLTIALDGSAINLEVTT
ncbi:hypothetical protein CXB49_10520 [Chromobacterium sp. ATCC 53434]|uniref:phage GP46 family protein n=1 Tax=Chromobacterium sp. (strain ATCC 53434 / SC 14030) TaxID=2059672 RepID=UPI000C78A8D2|nr:phage GP46 family protein [Chromobacterium sp. ATCC 53434]AUH51212.1 hypothetical protein CXB49_10520 [Chromobacterium sp. ATCC 53434]